MQYFGGKARIAKRICADLQPYVDLVGHYCEPFVGGGWICSGIRSEVRLASDANPHLIRLYKAIQAGWEPPDELSKEEYDTWSAGRDRCDSPMVAFAGFGCSFAGKFFGGYARGGEGRSYAKNAKNSLLKKNFDGVVFAHRSFETIDLKGFVVYCDPPYLGTTEYAGAPDFNYPLFYDWCRRIAKNNMLFVSEYTMPPDFEVVAEYETKTDIRVQSGARASRTERLFTQRA